jgi:hypothetical protein
MIAGACARGKSELHRARVPGESRGGAARRRQSRLARGEPRESNRDHSAAAIRQRRGAAGEKGNPPRSNLRIGRQQVARRGRKSRAVAEATTRPVRSRIERDDHHEQNSAYSPFTPVRSMVPLAQSAERRSVEPKVTGSSPVRHPKKGGVITPKIEVRRRIPPAPLEL